MPHEFDAIEIGANFDFLDFDVVWIFGKGVAIRADKLPFWVSFANILAKVVSDPTRNSIYKNAHFELRFNNNFINFILIIVGCAT